jgi:hypothetical protein
MATRRNEDRTRLEAAAETLGRAAGEIAGTVESWQAEHPHPIDEARELLAEGQQRIRDLGADIRARAEAAMADGATAGRRVRRAVSRTRTRARKAVRRTKHRVRKTRRAVRRTARKAKRTYARAKKAVRRRTRRARR